MTTLAMYYLTQGDYAGALLWVMNDYIGYGILWFLFGLAIFGTVYKKSRSTAMAGLFFAMFLGLINQLLPVEVQMYFLLIVGVMFFSVVYRVIR
jgi:hypothetical protein